MSMIEIETIEKSIHRINFKKKDWFNTEKKKELRKKLQEKARNYKIQDKRLEEFCKQHEKECNAVSLTQLGYSLYKKRIQEPKNIKKEFIEQAYEIGKALTEVNNIIEELVSEGVHVTCCFQVTKEILDPNAKDIEEYDENETNDKEEENDSEDFENEKKMKEEEEIIKEIEEELKKKQAQEQKKT